MRHFFLKVFSFLVWSAMFSYLILLFFGLCTQKWLFPSLRFRHFLQRLFGRTAYCSFSRIKVIIHPDFDPNRVSMFCQNHVSKLDQCVTCAALPFPVQICGVMHEWLFKIPVFGWLLKLSGGITLKKGSFNRLDKLEGALRDRMSKKLSILVFPEGTRSRDRKIRPFQLGVFLSARRVGLPVVPIVVHGLYEINQAESFLIRPGKITIYVGPQYETAHLTEEEIEALPQQLEQFARDQYASLSK